MKKIIRMCLVATACLGFMCGAAAAEEAGGMSSTGSTSGMGEAAGGTAGTTSGPCSDLSAAPTTGAGAGGTTSGTATGGMTGTDDSTTGAGKDSYFAIRLGFQPYELNAKGSVAGRSFDRTASLSDIMDDADTTLLGGEFEYGWNKWFLNLAAFYQESEFDRSNGVQGTNLTFERTAINPMLGYRVYGNRNPLSVDLMAGAYYVKVDADVESFDPSGNISGSRDIEFTDPMLGARAYLALTRNLGLTALGQIGGFGVGSEFHNVLAGSFVYNFTDWFAMSAGYKYWYWKYEDDDATLTRLSLAQYGPTIGVQFTF